MAKKTHIDVKVSIESIRDRLRKMLVSEHSHLIANVIMGNLGVTEVGHEELFRAMSGIKTEYKYKVGDWVLSKPMYLYSWKWDTNEMVKQDLMKGERVKCQIMEVLPHHAKPYKVKYKAVKPGTEEYCDTEVPEDNICLEEEWPENFKEEDLPF